MPAGVAAALEHAMHERGIPAIGIWAQVPHYIASMTYPAASVALLDGLREVTHLVIDAATLRSDVMIQGRRLDTLVSANEEHQAMIAQLEQLYDSSTQPMPGMQGPMLQIASADELAAEVEEFLRRQD